MATHKATEGKTCPHCGEPLQVRVINVPRNAHSAAHVRRWPLKCPCQHKNRCRRPLAMRLKDCAICGKPFAAGREVDKYCGTSCAGEATRRKRRRPAYLERKRITDHRRHQRASVALAWFKQVGIDPTAPDV